MSTIVAPAGTTESEAAELQRRRPINWDELGSSAKDLWVERNLRAIRKNNARIAARRPDAS